MRSIGCRFTNAISARTKELLRATLNFSAVSLEKKSWCIKENAAKHPYIFIAIFASPTEYIFVGGYLALLHCKSRRISYSNQFRCGLKELAVEK